MVTRSGFPELFLFFKPGFRNPAAMPLKTVEHLAPLREALNAWLFEYLCANYSQWKVQFLHYLYYFTTISLHLPARVK